jgi:hypothetical protein
VILHSFPRAQHNVGKLIELKFICGKLGSERLLYRWWHRRYTIHSFDSLYVYCEREDWPLLVCWRILARSLCAASANYAIKTQFISIYFIKFNCCCRTFLLRLSEWPNATTMINIDAMHSCNANCPCTTIIFLARKNKNQWENSDSENTASSFNLLLMCCSENETFLHFSHSFVICCCWWCDTKE